MKYLTIEQLIILIYYSWIIVGCVIIIYFLSLRRSSRNSGLWSVCRCVPNWSKNIFYRIYCFSIFEQYDKPPTWRIPPLWLWRKCEVVVRTNRICDDFCTLRIFKFTNYWNYVWDDGWIGAKKTKNIFEIIIIVSCWGNYNVYDSSMHCIYIVTDFSISRTFITSLHIFKQPGW